MPTVSRAQQLRQKLVNFGWRGWPYGVAQEAYTAIAHTEGGGLDNSRQTKVPAAYNPWRNNTDGRGLLMFTQMLDVTALDFDSGLRTGVDYLPPLQPRNLWTNWKNLPHA